MLQELFQSRQQQGDVLSPTAEAHQPNAPDLAGQLPKTAGDFDIVLI
jgi:hypothetical protein